MPRRRTHELVTRQAPIKIGIHPDTVTVLTRGPGARCGETHGTGKSAGSKLGWSERPQ
jgi:hypothetical protein